MPSHSTPFADAFDPRVTGFHTDKFSLREDLEWLDCQRGIRSPVGTILHGTRILEVLTRHAMTKVPRPQLPLADNVTAHLNHLLEKDHLTKETHTLLIELRTLGNQARHARGKHSFADAEQGYLLVLRCLRWYFCEFDKGPRLASLVAPGHSLEALLPAELARTLAILESSEVNGPGFLGTLNLDRLDCEVLKSFVFPAVLVERLLDRGRPDEAQTLLTAASARFPDEPRLRQLQGLLWSRTGQLEKACACLEALESTGRVADEETRGILAGVYKQRADAEPSRRNELLIKSHEKYMQGWQASAKSNGYLGINAAATALWLGRAKESVRIAKVVYQLIEERRKRVAPGFLYCWDQLTLAEAHLLLKEWNDATRWYAEAKKQFPQFAKVHDVARTQANKSLIALRQPDLIDKIAKG
jgi:tetratricopeptide (TPR) repeat protein